VLTVSEARRAPNPVTDAELVGGQSEEPPTGASCSYPTLIAGRCERVRGRVGTPSFGERGPSLVGSLCRIAQWGGPRCFRTAHEHAIPGHSRKRPHGRKVDQRSSLFVCFGLSCPTPSFIGIVPELFAVRHLTPPNLLGGVTPRSGRTCIDRPGRSVQNSTPT
jgi:hypothetical protein